MASKKPSPRVPLKVRQDRDKKEAARLINELKSTLHHHSPGVWEWIKDRASDVSDAVGAGWDWVNKQVDTYIWDTGTSNAVVEGWVRNVFNIPDVEGKGFVGEAWDKTTDVVGGWIDTAGEVVGDAWDTVTNTVYNVYNTAAGAVSTGWDAVTGWMGDRFSDLKDAIASIGDHLGASITALFAALAGLPDAIFGLGGVIAGLLTIDEETYVADSLKLLALNKQVTQATERMRT